MWIVARDRHDLYEQLKARFAGDPTVEVVLDRRQSDRRRGSDERVPDRRRRDRRRPSVQVLAKLWLQGYAVIHVEAPGEHDAAGEIAYRGYQVTPHSEHLPAGDWLPKAIVKMASGGTIRITPLYPDRPVSFPTREEADRYALEMAAKWLGQ